MPIIMWEIQKLVDSAKTQQCFEDKISFFFSMKKLMYGTFNL